MRSISLARLLNTSSEAEVATLLGQFKCSKNADLQDFLHNKAVDYEERKNNDPNHRKCQTWIFAKV